MRSNSALVALVALSAIVLNIYLFTELNWQDEILVLLYRSCLIFSVSLIACSAFAVIFRHITLPWRFVDYFWISSSFLTICATVIHLSIGIIENRAAINKASVLSAIDQVIRYENDFLSNVCAKRFRFPEIETVYPRCIGFDVHLKGLADARNEFAERGGISHLLFAEPFFREVYTPGAIMLVNDDPKPRIQSWENFNQSLGFVAINRINSSRNYFGESYLGDIMSINPIYFYYFMSFFVSLRLSKTTAEIVQVLRPKVSRQDV